MLASNVAAFSLVQPCSRLHYSRLAATEEEIAWMLAADDDDAWDDDEDDEAFDEQMPVSYTHLTLPTKA